MTKERKMDLEKRTFRIGELAHHLSLERFVIRFWEKEFNIQAQRTPGGQRFYDEKDLQKFKLIKELLYNKKFTIAGAREVIKTSHKGSLPSQEIIASAPTTLPKSEMTSNTGYLLEQIKEVRQKLLNIKKNL